MTIQIKEWSSVILKDLDNQYWVSKRIGNENDGLIQCPGGKLEQNETPREGALRELYEETSLECTNQELEFIRTNVYRKNVNEVRYVHIFQYQTNLRPILMEPDKSSEWYRINQSELDQLIAEEKTINSLRDMFKPKQKETKKILFDGNMGSGKTEMIRKLKIHLEKQGLEVQILPEKSIKGNSQIQKNLHKFWKYYKLYGKFKIFKETSN